MKDDKLVCRFAHIIREAENLSNEPEQLFYYINRNNSDTMTICIEINAPEKILDETIKSALNDEKLAEKVFYTPAYYDQLSRREALLRKPDIASTCMECGKHIEPCEERFPDYTANSKQVRCKRCCFREIEKWIKQQEEDDDIDDTDK